MIKNEEYIGEVINMGANGEGVVKNGADIVFVPFSISGEKIKYKIVKASKKANFGKLVDIIEPSVSRTEPFCKSFKKCGGCQLQHIEYGKQLDVKKDIISTCFYKIANLKIDVDNPICGESNVRYRNKLQLPVQFDKTKNIFGFYAENSHRVIDIDDCPINALWTSKIISCFKKFMAKFSLYGYNEENFSGDIREITVKEIGDNLIITVVGPKKGLKNSSDLIEILKNEFGDRFSLYYNFNDSKSNVIYSDSFTLLYGDKEYYSEMNGIKYGIGVKSFSQVNTEVCSKLYNKVVELVGTNKNSTVFDAYSGAGLMTAMLAKNAKKVIGIEIVKEAVIIADRLMELNGLNNVVKNYCGNCEELLPKLIKEARENGEEITVVLDPPRKGVDIAVINALIDAKPDKIVYVSCMPSTLARDVGLLVGSLISDCGEIKKAENRISRYNVESVTPFEMFPHTKHVETVVYLTKN